MRDEHALAIVAAIILVGDRLREDDGGEKICAVDAMDEAETLLEMALGAIASGELRRP